MKLTEQQYKAIEDCFPKHRKPAKISNSDAINAALYVLENGSKWRSMLKEYGNWHTIYTRIRRWAKNRVLRRVFLRLQQIGVIQN